MAKLEIKSNYYQHPVFDLMNFHLDTPAIKQLKEDVQRWLWTGQTGGIIYGESRIGKTHALRHLLTGLKLRDGKCVPVEYVSIPRRDVRTIKAIFRMLCFNVKLRALSRDTTEDLSERYVHYLAEKCDKSACTQILIVVDEMQRLQVRQFDAFAEVFDQLENLGIRTTIVFVGNEQESDHLLKLLNEECYAHLRGRFFTQRKAVYGLQSEADVRECLKQYDTLRFPEDGPSYTHYFVEQAVISNWKLSLLSKPIWQTFRLYQSTYGLKSWGMQYFVSTINILLADYLPCYGVDNYCEDMLKECLILSGLVPSKVKAG